MQLPQRQSVDMLIRIIRICIYVVPLLFIGIVIAVDANPSGIRTFAMSVSERAVAISPLFPPQRLAAAGDSEQQVLMEPIYFTVRYPHQYRTIEAVVGTVNLGDIPWTVGLLTKDGSYHFAKPDSLGYVSFDLGNAMTTSRSLRLAISIPGVSNTSYFAIKHIQIRLKRPGLAPTLRHILLRQPYE